ncbi:MAG TPA: FtsX-like permease family protein [Gammaproteobacteria bacterium]|nr:FtsX-like permease family protein [Gammaproteobacteria bacterium]
MLRHYVLLALRNVRRSPAAASLNVFTLTLGLVCFVILAGMIGFWERADQQFPKTSRTYVVTSKFDFANGTGPGRGPFTSHYVAQYLKADFPQIEAVARAIFVNDNASYVNGDRAIRLTEYSVDGELLDILDLPFIEGDAHTALKSPLSAVLTERVARQLFGADSALGKHVLLGGVWDATVTGVVGKIPEPSHMGRSATAQLPFDALTSRDLYESVLRTRFGTDTTTGPENWRGGGNLTYVLLPADGSLTAEQLRAQLPAFVKRHVPPEQQEHIKLELDLVPLGGLLVWTADNLTGNRGPSVASILWLLGGVVLGVACLNYANLSIARAAFRARDVGLRRALGASTRQVVAQSLVESALLATAAVALAIGVAALLAPAIQTATGIDLRLALLVDVRSWAATITLAAAVTLVAGALPALALARVQPVRALQGGAARLGPRALSTVLVGAQFFVTSVLLIAMAVSYLQNQHLERTGLARNSDPLLVMENYAALTHLSHETLHAELSRLPRVRAETAMVYPPWISADGEQVRRTPQEADAGQFALLYGVADDFFSTFEIPVLAGRALESKRGDAPPAEDGMRTSPQRVVIDRELASALGFATPAAAVGEILYGVRPGLKQLEIVGVVENRRLNVTSPGGIAMHNLYTLDADPTFHVARIAADDVAATVADVDALWRRLVPTMAPNRRFMDEYFNDSFDLYQRLNQGFVGLAAFTLLIATMGLFAMALFVVARRKREIAVRKVLGARTEMIVSLLLRAFAWPVVVASVLAWPVAYLAARGYLTQFVDPIAVTPWPFLACLLFALAIALLAVGGQTWRAARPPPANALRSE